MKANRPKPAACRFCFDHGTSVNFAIPEGAQLRDIRIFSWLAPDELIKVTAAQVPEQRSSASEDPEYRP